MKKLIAVMLVLCLGVTGCTGTFALTRKVYNFHTTQGDKWANEFAFLVVWILPIYGISTLADAIVFNSIEFWTGDNPVNASADGTSNVRHVKAGDDQATITYDKATDQLVLRSQTSSGENPQLVFERSGSAVFAKDAEGRVLYASMQEADGGIAIYDKDMQLVKRLSSDEVSRIKERMVN